MEQAQAFGVNLFNFMDNFILHVLCSFIVGNYALNTML
jgi:hypothetical protein